MLFGKHQRLHHGFLSAVARIQNRGQMTVKRRTQGGYLRLFVLILLMAWNLPTTAEPKTYLLDIPLPDIPFPNHTGRTLLVSMPKASPGFDTSSLVYIHKYHALEYYKKSQWIDTPARMLLPLLVLQLEATGKFKAVLSASTSPIACELRLDTEIVRLQQEFQTEPSLVRLVLRAQLLDMAVRRVLATHVFEVEKSTQSEDAEGGVIAANQAVKKVLNDLTAFVVEQMNL
ncbi:MAG: ABC-type transport auxiliary lipoprotein family protein [Candidatus Parabeggiatoa sp.]|nr:ABC-type transport auxiliary lipoprotein family protein [Candidatus Parabeggiatoa sp.]